MLSDNLNDDIPLLCELNEKSPMGEPMSIDLAPEKDEPKLLASKSEADESLLAIPVSRSSYNEGNIRSTLGLPLLTNDISESGTDDDSYGVYDLPALVNGDLSVAYDQVSPFPSVSHICM